MINRRTRKDVSSYKVVTEEAVKNLMTTRYFKKAIAAGLPLDDMVVGSWDSDSHSKTYRISIGNYCNQGKTLKEAFGFAWYCFQENGTQGLKLANHVDGRRGSYE